LQKGRITQDRKSVLQGLKMLSSIVSLLVGIRTASHAFLNRGYIMSNTYNGWTNYATWRVNLEMFDGGEWETCTAEDFKQMAEESLEQEASGLALDYALAFLSDVNWEEIAEAYNEEEEEEEEEYSPEEIALQASIEEKTERMM
jgi:hypothetical protein